jgi:bisphosphoglycerate-dependent phosphoglycerate mutase
VSYTNVEARQQLLDTLAAATEQLARALAALTAAYEALDDQQADRLEQQLFRPVQRAFGRAQRTHAAFAERYGLERRTFETPIPEAPSTGVRAFVDHAAEATATADTELADLQDSLMPVEFGDEELRAGLSEVRQLIDGFPELARQFVGTYGR